MDVTLSNCTAQALINYSLQNSINQRFGGMVTGGERGQAEKLSTRLSSLLVLMVNSDVSSKVWLPANLQSGKNKNLCWEWGGRKVSGFWGWVPVHCFVLQTIEQNTKLELLEASFYFGLAIKDLRASWNHSDWASAVVTFSQLLWCDGSFGTSTAIMIIISPRTVLLLFF